MLGKCLGLSLAIGLCACAPAEATNAVPPTEDADTVFTDAADGTLVHKASGLRFPAAAAEFRLSEASVFSNSGDYVGVEYVKELSSAGPIRVRVAVVNIGGMNPRTHYTIMKPRATHGMADLRIVSEGPFRRATGTDGYGGVFSGTRNGVAGTVGLWAFEQGTWDLRVLAEFPDTYSGQAAIDVGDLVTALRQVNQGN